MMMRSKRRRYWKLNSTDIVIYAKIDLSHFTKEIKVCNKILFSYCSKIQELISIDEKI